MGTPASPEKTIVADIDITKTLGAGWNTNVNGVRMSDGTLIVAVVNTTTDDVEFHFSDDEGVTWTQTATAWTGTWSGTNNGVSLTRHEDDTLWVTAGNSTNNPWLSTWTWDGSDVTAGMAAMDIKRAATTHYSTRVFPITDPSDSGQYRVLIFSSDSGSTVARLREFTVDKDWTNPSSITAVFASATTPGSAWERACFMKTLSGTEYSSVATPEFLVMTSAAGSDIRTELVTWNGSGWTASTQRSIGQSWAAYGIWNGFYNHEYDEWFVATSASTTVYALKVAGDGLSAAAALGTTGSLTSLDTTHSGLIAWDPITSNLYLFGTDGSSYEVRGAMLDISTNITGTWTRSASHNNMWYDTNRWWGTTIRYPMCMFPTGDDTKLYFVLDFYGGSSVSGDLHFRHGVGGWNATYIDPEIRSHTIASGMANGRPYTVSKPTGTVEGDLIVAVFSVSDYPSLTFDSWDITGTGWLAAPAQKMSQYTHTSGYIMMTHLFYKVAGPSEPSTWDFSWSGSGSSNTAMNLILLTFKGPGYHAEAPFSYGRGQLVTTHNSVTSSAKYGAKPFRGMSVMSETSHGTAGVAQPHTPATNWTEYVEIPDATGAGAINTRLHGATDLDWLDNTGHTMTWDSAFEGQGMLWTVDRNELLAAAGGVGWGITL